MKWSADRLMSITAVIVSMGTLFTIIYQTNIFRKQQYASVLPYLELWNSSNKSSYRLILVNNGIGPAFIEEIKIHFNDSVYLLDPANFYKEVIQKQDTISFGYSNIRKGRLIPSGDDINLVAVQKDSLNAKKLWSWFSGDDPNRASNIEIEIMYSSVYGEKWLLKRNSDAGPVQIN